MSFLENELSLNNYSNCTVSRVQKYLLEKGKFQMNQMLVLQDDEIARLKKRLKMLKQDIIVSTKNARKNYPRDLLAKRDSLKKIIEATYSNKEAVIQKIINNYNDKRENAMNRHQTTLSQLNESACQSMNISKSPIKDDQTEILNDTFQSIAEKIELFENEQSKIVEKAKAEAKEAIHRYKIQSKANRVRCQELKEKIQELQQVIKTERQEKENKMNIFNEQIKSFEQKLIFLKSDFYTKVNNLDDNFDDSDLKQLQSQVEAANVGKKEVRSRIEQTQLEFQEENENLEKEKYTLLKQLNLLQKDTHDINYIDQMHTVKENIVNMQVYIQQCGPTLKKLREENLELRRKVNQCDYVLNGRTGHRQRFTEITRQEYQS